jgi:hypothetical protein
LFTNETSQPGDAFIIIKDPDGDILKPTGKTKAPGSIEVINDLAVGSVNINLYKNEKLLAVKSGVSPTQKAVFIFNPSIWIGVVSADIQEGQVLDSKIISGINTEFSLAGIKSADIVMTGGGQVPYRFAIENIIKTE